MKRIFRLSHDIARSNAIECVRTAPEGWVVEVKEPTRSLEQNAMIHALLTEVGVMLGWKFNGQSVDLDDLKTIFMAAYRKATGQNARFAIGLDGQPVMLNWRTRDLNKREASDFVEMVHAWMAENQGRKTA